jgi:hypothetical protein
MVIVNSKDEATKPGRRKMKQAKAKEGAVTRPVKKTKGEIKGLYSTLWYYMKKQFPSLETQLAYLNEATCPAKVNGAPVILIRIFKPDSAKEKGVTVEDYESLNEHPELILYEGYHIRGRGGEILIKKWEGAGASLLEEKIKQGAITEVGIIMERTAAQKWLGGLGKFMMMGGFILVLFIIAGIAISISIAFKGC